MVVPSWALAQPCSWRCASPAAATSRSPPWKPWTLNPGGRQRRQREPARAGRRPVAAARRRPGHPAVHARLPGHAPDPRPTMRSAARHRPRAGVEAATRPRRHRAGGKEAAGATTFFDTAGTRTAGRRRLGRRCSDCPSGAELSVDAPTVAVVDMSGAGDAFNAGLAPSLANGHDWPDALRAATDLASSIIPTVPLGGTPSPPRETDAVGLHQRNVAQVGAEVRIVGERLKLGQFV